LKHIKETFNIINKIKQKMANSYQSKSTETPKEEMVNESFVYKLSLKDYILRMLILGTRVNKYDQKLKNISKEDCDYIKSEIDAGNGLEILNVVADAYINSRAPKLDISLNMLAILCRAKEPELKAKSLEVVEKFRTISHLYSWKNFHANVVNPETGAKTKGNGRAVKRAVNKWILDHRPKANDLAYQITKYQTREGWSFKNLLQCTHASTDTGDDRAFSDKSSGEIKKRTLNQGKHDVRASDIDLVLRYAVNGYSDMDTLAKKWSLTTPTYHYLKAVHLAKHYTKEQKPELIDTIYEHKLTREQIPTWGLIDTEVLLALLVNKKKTRVSMPLTALLRNLGNMTNHSVFDDDEVVQIVINHITKSETISYSHIHPVTVLIAWFTYRSGQGNKGSNTWSPNDKLVKALEEMFYSSFKNVEPTGKRICFLIDASGSMCSPSLCEGVTNAEAAALLAMIFARSETSSEKSPDHSFYLFTSNTNNGSYGSGRTGLTDVSDLIDASASLDNVLQSVQRSDWGTTDISMGILQALKYKRKYDAFVVITDNDVNSGIKPSEAMKQYRTDMKMPTTKLIVVATQGSNITIADPQDPFMMDMCGFDSHGPKILQDFIRS
jgi:60 kDa SS-A/Ro ribonucleoprotein